MKAITKSKFQVVYLYASTLMGSLLGFATSIVNTRFLTDEEYGDVRYVQNLITLFSWLLLFGYFHAGNRLLALSDDEVHSRKVRGAMIVILGVCFVALLLMTLFAGLFHIGQKECFLFMVSLPVCFYPLFTNYVNTTAQGDNYIGRLAISRVLPPIIYVVMALLIFKYIEPTSSFVILLQWGVYSLVFAIIIISTRPRFKELKPIYASLKTENSAYGAHLYYGSLAMIATHYLAGLMLGVFNDDNTNVGYYTLALTLTTPLSYLPGIIGTAYFKKFVNEPAIPQKVFKATMVLTVASCILFMSFIHIVVDWFYPASYAIVARYAAWLAIAFSVHGIGDMINRFLGSHGHGVPIRNSSYMCGAFKVFGFIVLVWLWNVEGALITNVVSSSIYTLVLYIYYRKIVCKKANR